MHDRVINEFVKDVTKDMGWKQRSEAKRELRAHILDSSEALATERNMPVTDLIVREVICKMGPPEEIAAMYPYPSKKKNDVSDKIFIICMAIIIAFAAIIIIGLIVSGITTILTRV